jgi:hypothetical protein
MHLDGLVDVTITDAVAKADDHGLSRRGWRSTGDRSSS